MDVWIIGFDCFGTITTIYHHVFEDITDFDGKHHDVLELY
jgi:hypothetical protein